MLFESFSACFYALLVLLSKYVLRRGVKKDENTLRKLLFSLIRIGSCDWPLSRNNDATRDDVFNGFLWFQIHFNEITWF